MKRAAWSMAALALFAGSAFAQTPSAGPNCLFPLACPGPTPQKPEPLLGPPEEQGAAPAPAEKVHKTKRHAQKRRSKSQADDAAQ